MAGDEIEEAFLEQGIFYPAQHSGRISFADLGDQHAYGKRALLAQAACDDVGFITKTRGCLKHTPLGLFGNAVSFGSSIDHSRNGRLREAEICGKLLQRNGLSREWVITCQRRD